MGKTAFILFSGLRACLAMFPVMQPDAARWYIHDAVLCYLLLIDPSLVSTKPSGLPSARDAGDCYPGSGILFYCRLLFRVVHFCDKRSE